MSGSEEEAIHALVERRIDGGAGESDIAALETWRRRSPENEAEYQRMRQLCEAARDLQPPAATLPQRPTAAEIIAQSGWRRTARPVGGRAVRWVGAAVAAAALVLLGRRSRYMLARTNFEWRQPHSENEGREHDRQTPTAAPQRQRR